MRKDGYLKLKNRVLGEENQYNQLFYYGVFGFIALFFFYNLYHIVFTVHDDILMYTIARNRNIWDEALFAAEYGRLPQLWNYYLLSIPFLANKLWVYKLIAYLSLLFDIGAMWYFVYKHINRDFANLCAIAFLAFATISPQHNLFISYALCHQIPIGLFFLAFHFFIVYDETKKVKYQVISSILYLFSCMIYETFLFYMLVFGVASLFMQARRKTNFVTFVKNVIISFLPQLILALIYTAVYKIWQHYYPSPYEGIALYLKEPIYSLKVIYEYSLSLFPVSSMEWLRTAWYIDLESFINSITGASIVKALLVACSFCLVTVTAAKKIKFKGHLVVAFVATFTPCILIGFNEKYLNREKEGINTYIPSFYSYMALIILFCGLVILLYRYIKPPVLRVVYLLVLSCFVILFSFGSDFTVDYWKAKFMPQEVRYENFDVAASSDIIVNCDSDWQIYAPDNMGIHGLEEYTLKYFDIYDDTPVGGFVRTSDLINWEKNVMILRSDDSYTYMVAGEIDSEYHATQITFMTSLPGQFTVVMKTESGQTVTYRDITNGTVITCPEGDEFDMTYRVHS